MLEFTDAELHAKAEQLGLVGPGEKLTASMASRVKAALVEERRATARPAAADDEPPVARQIVIRRGRIEMDGQALPAAADPVEIHVSADPDLPSTVRLTLLADTVQTTKEK